jgi:TRAP-type mannitol/chloroaromatic compound transport system permease small subunit
VKTVVRIIDSISGYAGGLAKWLCYALVLVIVYDVTMRYVFDSPTMWAFETAMMIGGSLYSLAFAYTHLYRGHVRVDILYIRLSPRGRAVIDVMGILFLFLPLLGFLIRSSFSMMWRAWAVGETSDITTWYPPVAPFRTMVLLGFCLLALQAAAHFIRDLYVLFGKEPS